MPDHDPFLTALAERPGDDTLRLVYADWLDEHGLPDHAAFLRLEVRLRRAERGPGWFALCRAFLRAANATPDDWRELVSRPRLAGTTWRREYLEGFTRDEVQFRSTGQAVHWESPFAEPGGPDGLPAVWRQFGPRVELVVNAFSLHRGTIHGDELRFRGRELKPRPGDPRRYSECWTLTRVPGPDWIPNLE